MNILYYFPKNDTVMFRWQDYHIFNELEKYDCPIEEFHPEDYSSIDIANEELIAKIKNKKYDLFMTSYHEDILYIDTIIKIKSYGVKTLLFCPDNLKIPFQHKIVSPYFDLTWLTSRETEYLFKKWGAKTIFLPYAANPDFLKPNSFMDEEIERICFVGTPYGSRVDTINKLIDSNVKISIYTSLNNSKNKFINDDPKNYVKTILKYLRYKIGWKLAWSAIINKFSKRRRNIDLDRDNVELLKPLALKDLSNAYSKYALSLSYGAAGSSGILRHPVDVVNLRNFEIPMAGGLQFTRYTKELANYFEDGKEIVFYHNYKEMIEKAKFYLSPDQKEIRDKIKKNARERAVRDHCWICRFEVIFDLLGLTNYKRREK